MREYVCGFLFTEDKKNVVLIDKLKPEWQAGLLNGVGGKIEPGEAATAAMIREFEEETGLFLPWGNMFCVLTQTSRPNPDEHWRVYFFSKFVGHQYDVDSLKQMTSEYVQWYEVATLQLDEIVPNLAWLIPMALEENISAACQQKNWPHPC